MFKAKIKLVFRQVIDQSAESAYEKAIFHASYQEFLVKSEAYNVEGKFKTFSRIKANDERATSLHDKMGFAVGHLIAQLDNKIPSIKDNLGNKLSFETAGFEVIESHIEDISLHKVAINYITDFLSLIEFMGEYLLLAQGDISEFEPLETFVLRMQPDLSIVSYLQANHPKIVLSAS